MLRNGNGAGMRTSVKKKIRLRQSLVEPEVVMFCRNKFKHLCPVDVHSIWTL